MVVKIIQIFVLFRIPSSKDAIFTTPIECKGIIPKFNNNPPKKNDNCIYICGNTVFTLYRTRK